MTDQSTTATSFVEQLEELDAYETPTEEIRDLLAQFPRTDDVRNALKKSSFLFDFLSYLEYEDPLDVEIVEAYLELCPEAAGVPSTECGFEEEEKYYLLHAACQNGNISEARIFELLIEASPKRVFTHLSTLGDLACGCGVLENSHDLVGGCPLHYYVMWGSSSLPVVKLLVEACPETLTIADKTNKLRGVTPLHAMMDPYDPGEKVVVIKYLIEQNPSVLRTPNGFGWLPIHSLCSNANATLDVVKLLVEAWPESIHEKDIDGESPMSIAAIYNHHFREDPDFPIIEYLKMNGGDRGEVFLRLLEEVCHSDQRPHKSIKKLFGLIPEYKTDGFKTAVKTSPFLHYFFGWYSKDEDQITLEIIETLLDVCPEAASITSNVTCPDSQKHNFSYPIHEACSSGLGCRDEIIELLVEKTEPGAFSHMCVCSYMGLFEGWQNVAGTPLHYYVTHGGNAKIVKLLVEKCPEAVTIMDGRNKLTPLHSVLHSFHVEPDVVKFLVESNPSALHSRDENGRLPLHAACQNGSMVSEIVRLLLDTWPESIWERCEETGILPLHFLLLNSPHYNVYPQSDSPLGSRNL